MVEKTLDKKLAEIHADPQNSKAFIICDAKDADIARGLYSCGAYSPEYHHGELNFRSIHEYRDMMRQVVHQGIVDIVLMSPSTNEVLTIQERLFDNSHVTPAGRTNDTTDIHVFRGASYATMASRPFRSSNLDYIQCGKYECKPEERTLGADLGLYSVTFNNDLERDLATLEAFKQFRMEAELKNFRYFLEVFDPNVPGAVPQEKIAAFVNDAIQRNLAGVTERGRPVFLKMVYHGPKAMEELAHFDPHLIVGVLGGSAGTTYDAFKLIGDSQKYGGRVALFGRKINQSENQLAFIKFLRMIVDGDISPEEAVKAYHGVLQGSGIKPFRSLEDDMQITDPFMGYGEGSSTVTVPAGVPASNPAPQPAAAPAPQQPRRNNALRDTARPRLYDEEEPDFSKMTLQEKMDYNQRRRDRIFG